MVFFMDTIKWDGNVTAGYDQYGFINVIFKIFLHRRDHLGMRFRALHASFAQF